MRGRGRPSASRCSKSGRMRLSGEGSCSIIVANPSSREVRSASARSSAAPRNPCFNNSRTVCSGVPMGQDQPPVVELNPERGVVARARCRRASIRSPPSRAVRDTATTARRRVAQLSCDRMIHQVAPHLVAGIGDSTRTRIAPRLQQQLRRFDSVGGDDEHLADGPLVAAVRTLEPDRGDATVGADLDGGGDRLIEELGPGALGLRDMHRRVVLRLHGTDGNAAAAAAARGPALVRARIPRLWRRLRGEARSAQRRRHPPIQIAHRNGRQRIGLASRRVEVGSGITGDAQLAFRFAVPRLEIVVGNRPIDADAESGSQSEIIGHKPQRRPEPMPRRAAHLSQVRAVETIRSVLQVVRDPVDRFADAEQTRRSGTAIRAP